MKMAINHWSFSPDKSVTDCLKLAKDAGFDGIELALGETGECSLESTESEIKGFVAAAQATGIEISSLACGLYWAYPLTHDDPAVREQAQRILHKEIEVASWLGVDGILVVPGCVHAGFIPDCPVVPYEVAYQRATDAVRAQVPFAEEKGVTIGIENVWNKFLLSPLEMAQFIDQFGSERVGAYFDVGNVLLTGLPEQWIRILGKRIRRVHFKDFRVNVGTLDGFVDLLAGDVNWPEVMQAFGEIGYDGWAAAEMIPAYKHHTDQIIYNTAGAMRRILGRGCCA